MSSTADQPELQKEVEAPATVTDPGDTVIRPEESPSTDAVDPKLDKSEEIANESGDVQSNDAEASKSDEKLAKSNEASDSDPKVSDVQLNNAEASKLIESNEMSDSNAKVDELKDDTVESESNSKQLKKDEGSRTFTMRELLDELKNGDANDDSEAERREGDTPHSEQSNQQQSDSNAALELINSVTGADEEGRSRQRILTYAARRYASALERNPEDYDALYNWALVLQESADNVNPDSTSPSKDDLLEEACKKYEEATRLCPTLNDAYYNWAIAISDRAKIRGRTKEAEELWKQATKNYEKAVQLNWNSPQALNNWGLALQELSAIVPAREKLTIVKMAISKFRAAIQLQFDFHRAIYNLGTVLYGLAEDMSRTGGAVNAKDISPNELYSQSAIYIAAAHALKPNYSVYTSALKLVRSMLPLPYLKVGYLCKTPKSVDSTVDIFVKRIIAASDADTAHNVWLLQGGPGASSTAMESAMIELHSRLDGAVNVYTMDHRGTGRSTLLDCVAAQVTTTGSPWGSAIEPSEVPACAQALELKYGNLSSFSITSAATDIATFISDYSNGANTIVYGVSYGTALVERLIHLDPPEVTGYVLDGVATTSGASADKFEYFSTWDADFGDVGDAFMALCVTKKECNERFASKILPDTLQNVITQFDNNQNSTCAALVSKVNSDQSSDPPSYILRRALGSLLQSASTRTLIPPVVYRLNRCAPRDIDILTHFFTALNTYNSAPNEEDAYESNLLYYLIVFSEMWETPEPSISEMIARFTKTRISNGGTYSDIPNYCAFSKEVSTVCNELDVGTYDANGIIYERDEYWNKSATIPSQASVLLLNGKLDPQTPYKYAEYLLDALDGSKKELILFNYATHGTLWTTPLVEGDDSSATCSMELLMSYVSTDGDLDTLDKTCVDEMPALNLTPPLAYQYYLLSTEDAYDGVYDANLAAQVAGSSSSFTGFGTNSVTAVTKTDSTYKIVFIVFLVLFVVASIFAGYFAFQWHRLKRQNSGSRVTDDLSENVQISTPAEVVASSPEITTIFSTERAK